MPQVLVRHNFKEAPTKSRPTVSLKDAIAQHFPKMESIVLETPIDDIRVVTIERDDLNGRLFLAKFDGELIFVTKDECDQVTRRRGLRLINQPPLPAVELIGSVIYTTSCHNPHFCPYCQMCDSPLES